MPQQIQIERLLKDKFSFTGELIASLQEDEALNKASNPRKFELYRAESDGYVLISTLRISYPYKRDLQAVIPFSTLQEMYSFMKSKSREDHFLMEELMNRAFQNNNDNIQEPAYQPPAAKPLETEEAC